MRLPRALVRPWDKRLTIFLWSVGSSSFLFRFWKKHPGISCWTVHFVSNITNHPMSIIAAWSNWFGLEDTLRWYINPSLYFGRTFWTVYFKENIRYLPAWHRKFCGIRIHFVRHEIDFQMTIHPKVLWPYSNQNFSFGLYSIGQMAPAPLILVLASS